MLFGFYWYSSTQTLVIHGHNPSGVSLSQHGLPAATVPQGCPCSAVSHPQTLHNSNPVIYT